MAAAAEHKAALPMMLLKAAKKGDDAKVREPPGLLLNWVLREFLYIIFNGPCRSVRAVENKACLVPLTLRLICGNFEVFTVVFDIHLWNIIGRLNVPGSCRRRPAMALRPVH